MYTIIQVLAGLAIWCAKKQQLFAELTRSDFIQGVLEVMGFVERPANSRLLDDKATAFFVESDFKNPLQKCNRGGAAILGNFHFISFSLVDVYHYTGIPLFGNHWCHNTTIRSVTG